MVVRLYYLKYVNDASADRPDDLQPERSSILERCCRSSTTVADTETKRGKRALHNVLTVFCKSRTFRAIGPRSRKGKLDSVPFSIRPEIGAHGFPRERTDFVSEEVYNWHYTRRAVWLERIVLFVPVKLPPGESLDQGREFEGKWPFKRRAKRSHRKRIEAVGKGNDTIHGTKDRQQADRKNYATDTDQYSLAKIVKLKIRVS